MITYSVTFPVQEVLAECIEQVSLDFRAIRATAGTDVDRSYDDFILSADEREPFAAEFLSQATALCADYPAMLRPLILSDVRLSMEVSLSRMMPLESVERMLKDCMKARMLGWWYRVRNVELSREQEAKAAEAGERLLSAFNPSCTVRRLRYF